MSKNFELMLKSGPHELLGAVHRSPRPAPRGRVLAQICEDEEILPFVHSLSLAQGSRQALRSVMFASVEASGQSANVCARVARAVALADW